MKLKPLLTIGLLFGITIQAVASPKVKAPYPIPPTPTAAPAKNVPTSTPAADFPLPGAKNNAPSKSAQPNLGSQLVASNQVPGVSVWPNPSQGGHSILFKAPSDPGSAIQLSIQNSLGQVVFTTSFSSRSGRSGGYVWRLQNLSGAPVASGVYVYILHFTKDGQAVSSTGKVTVLG